MKKVLYGSLFFVPMLAFAQPNLSGIKSLVQDLGAIIKLVGPIVFGIAIIYFFWGVAQYILAAGDPKKAAEGRSIMIYGVIAIAVMASIYGLVGLLQNTFGVSTTTTITPPALP